MPGTRTTTGLPPGVHLGPTGPRLLSALVEVGPVWLLTALAVVFVFLLDGRAVIAALFALLAVGWAVLVWAQRAARAAGPGMRLDSLQLVGFHDGRPIGWGRVLLRWLVFAGLTISVVGLIAMAVVMSRHPRRQGWHDLVADAVVIKERPLAPARPKPAVARSAAPAGSDRPAVPAARRTTPRPDAPPRTPAKSPSPASAPTRVAAPASAPASSSPASSSPASPAPASPASPTSPSPVLAVDEETSAPEPARTDFEWWLRMDDGRDIGIERLVLLGRNPQPRVGEEDATLIKVSDEGRTVSKSHLAVGVDAGGLYVMDRGSTNGTTVTDPDGGQRPCPPGDLIDVPSGSVVSFGDHWLEVRRPGHG